MRNRGPRASVSLENRHYLIFLIIKSSNQSSHRSRRVVVTFPSSAHPQMRWQACGTVPMLPVVRRAPPAWFPSSGFEMSPWAGQDGSAVTAGLGPQVPNVCHEVKKHGAGSLLLPVAGQRRKQQPLHPGTRRLLRQPPSSKAAPSLCGRRLLPPQHLTEGNLQLSCFCVEVSLSQLALARATV